MVLGCGMRLKTHCQVNMKKETQIYKIRDEKGKITKYIEKQFNISFETIYSKPSGSHNVTFMTRILGLTTLC